MPNDMNVAQLIKKLGRNDFVDIVINDLPTRIFTEGGLQRFSESARAAERTKTIGEVLELLVDDVYSRQAQAVIDRRNSDPMCTTPYPREARWKDERNRFRAELRAKLVEMKGEK